MRAGRERSRSQRARRWVRRGALAALAAYVLLALLAALFSDRLIFRPPPRSPQKQGRDAVTLVADDGVRLSAAYLANPSARYTILYSHGNGEDLSQIRAFLERLRSWGFSVLAYDYHGYGASAGKPSERATYLDIDAAYEYLTTSKGIPPERIVLFGHSLGGGPSVDLAARRPVAGLILDSAFTSAFRAVTRIAILPFDKFRNIAKIRRVRAPVLVMHGTADRVVPFRQGIALYRAAGEPKSSLWVKQGGHEGLYQAPDGEYRTAVTGFCEGLERGQAGRPPEAGRPEFPGAKVGGGLLANMGRRHAPAQHWQAGSLRSQEGRAGGEVLRSEAGAEVRGKRSQRATRSQEGQPDERGGPSG